MGRRCDRDVAKLCVGPGSYHQDFIGFQDSDTDGTHRILVTPLPWMESE